MVRWMQIQARFGGLHDQDGSEHEVCVPLVNTARARYRPQVGEDEDRQAGGEQVGVLDDEAHVPTWLKLRRR